VSYLCNELFRDQKGELGPWKRCPDMMTERLFASCGAVKRGDRREEVVVAGGYKWPPGCLDTVEIFSLTKLQWRSGMENIQLVC
jgi:hypothetical protein